MQRQDLTREQCRAAVSVRLIAACLLVQPTQRGNATFYGHLCALQSLVDGDINVAQAAAFMVLLHSKVTVQKRDA